MSHEFKQQIGKCGMYQGTEFRVQPDLLGSGCGVLFCNADRQSF